MNKISLTGDLGSGKSTVARLLIDALGAEYYSTGGIVRSIAERMGMTIGELNLYMETHPEIDTEIDDGLKALGSLDKPMVIDSRMAWHFTSDTFKVYLSTDTETSALRIMNANRQGEHASTLEDTISDTRARKQSEMKRYMKQYGVDVTDLSNYSLIVDTTYASPEQIAGVIISCFERCGTVHSRTRCYLSPERLNYADDGHDETLLAEYSARLDLGDDIPEIEVFEHDGEFYIHSGMESALAYALGFYDFVPAVLVDAPADSKKYVKMKNSL